MLTTLTLLAALQAAPAIDSIAGPWQIKGDIMGNPLDQLCTLAQDAARLTGSCTGPLGEKREVTGEVKDGKVTLRHGGDYQGQALTFVYSATLASPKELKGTVEVQPFGVTGTFTAAPARVPAAPKP